MTPAAHTVAAVSTLLSADAGVSAELREAIVGALRDGGRVNIKTDGKIVRVSRTTYWRMRKQGRVSVRAVGPRGRAVFVSVASVINQGGVS